MKSRNKDRKTHESIIGKIIYGFLLFMPLLAIGVTCAYAIFNKNAYQSYSDNALETSVNVTEISQYTEGQLYYFDYKTNITNGTNPVRLDYISLTKEQLNSNQTEYDSLSKWWLNTNNRIYFSNDNQTIIKYINYDDDLSFQFKGQITSEYLNIAYINRVVITTQKLDNVFYYSIEKVEQSPLFNWAENSAIYTGITTTCSALNITTPFIPLLMTYWLIISVIYILYDIILVILHIFHKKIHQLENSL